MKQPHNGDGLPPLSTEGSRALNLELVLPSTATPQIVPRTLREANAFVQAYHRHSKKTRGCKFAVALMRDGFLVGVAISGRPVARVAQGWSTPTAEVLRVCVLDGVPNGCSMLYGASRRALVAVGYRRVLTYLKSDESGTSVRAAGFRVDCDVEACQHDGPTCPAWVYARRWHCESRPRADRHMVVDRLRYIWP